MRYQNTYDTNGNLTHSIDLFYNSTSEYKYNQNNQLIELKENNTLLIVYTYNENKLIESELIYRIYPDEDKENSLLDSTSYSYYDNGLLSQKIKKNILHEFTYNKKGKLINRKKLFDNQIIFYEDFIYDKFGRETDYINSNGQWHKQTYLHSSTQNSKFDFMKKTSYENSSGYKEKRSYDSNGYQNSFYYKINDKIWWDKHILNDNGDILYYENSDGHIVKN